MAQTFIKTGKFNFRKPQFEYVPEIAKQLIKQMLTVNPANRPTIDEVIMHPWLQDEDNFNGYFDSILYTDEAMREPPAKRRRIEWF